MLFATLGAPGAHLERFVLSLKSRDYGVKQALSAQHGPDALAEAAAAGLKVRDMRREVLERPAPEVRADHWQLPY